MSKTRNLITSAQAASILGFSPDHVRKLILRGQIKAEKWGLFWYINPKNIAHIKRQRKRKEM